MKQALPFCRACSSTSALVPCSRLSQVCDMLVSVIVGGEEKEEEKRRNEKVKGQKRLLDFKLQFQLQLT
jgi:hypothetical protein